MKSFKNNVTKRLIATVLTSLLMLTLVVQTSEVAEASSDAGEATLSVGIGADPGTMDPSAQGGGDFMSVIACVMEPLWEVTDEGETIWLLAESVEEVSDTQWTIHLREGVTFSNGNPFTADDVLFTLQTVRDSFTAVRTQSMDIDNTKKIDDYTVDMRFTEYNIQSFLAFTLLFMYDAESYDAETFGMNPIGTGPYTVENYVVNSEITLARRDDYWGETPDAKTISVRVLGETSQVVNALETGMIDVGNVASSDVEYVSGLQNYYVKEHAGTDWAVFGFNPLETSVFHDVNARYAVTHLIEKDAVVNLVYNGSAKVMNGPVISSAFDYSEKYDNLDDSYAIGYDLELAQKLADESGLTGQTIVIATNGVAEYVTMAEMLKNQLGKIGVGAEIKNYDPASFITALSSPPEYDIAIQGYIIPNMYISNSYANGILFTPAYNVAGSWEGSDRYFELAQVVNSISDDAERTEMLDEMIEIFSKACIIYSICEPTYHRAFSTKIAEPIVFTSAGLNRYQDFKLS